MRRQQGKGHTFEPADAAAERAAVSIGDAEADQFTPEVRIERAAGYLRIRHPHAKERGGQPERVRGGTVEIVRGKGRSRATHRFYEVPDPAEQPLPIEQLTDQPQPRSRPQVD